MSDTASVEALLTTLPSQPCLAGDAAERFEHERLRISRHHRLWRANRPAIDDLFEDDAHRAKALAANLATELEQSLAAWALIYAEVAGEGGEELETRLAEMASEWTAVALRYRDSEGWDEEPDAVFDEFMVMLVERAVVRARDAHGGALLQRRQARRWLLPEWLARPFRRLFRPGSD